MLRVPTYVHMMERWLAFRRHGWADQDFCLGSVRWLPKYGRKCEEEEENGICNRVLFKCYTLAAQKVLAHVSTERLTTICRLSNAKIEQKLPSLKSKNLYRDHTGVDDKRMIIVTIGLRTPSFLSTEIGGHPERVRCECIRMSGMNSWLKQ